MTTVDGDPQIESVARLFADHSRATICLALSDGCFRTAGELARIARVSAQTASGHLSLLVDGGILVVVRQGRQRYFRMAGSDVAAAVAALGMIAPNTPIRSLRQDRVARELSNARSCYDHLAGRLGVALTEGMVRCGILTIDFAVADLSLMDHIGVDLEGASRPMVRPCIDWTERKYHVAGTLPAALMQRLFELGWLERAAQPRLVIVTADGMGGLADTFDVCWPGRGRVDPDRSRGQPAHAG